MRVTLGRVSDVFADQCTNSPIFGRWVGKYLSEVKKRMLWVSVGGGRGFLVISDTADFQYKCTNFFGPMHECCICWCYPALNLNLSEATSEDVQLWGKDNEVQSLEQSTPELTGHY
ncbi:dTDP-4-dehydrorhamnose 3,5-epimerase family protein [Marinobacter nauticus]|uniref:dTDP-4-dehydrorhamnose 3,5-epimerase n=1 Tax=Marinobacter nauticus (strain ATCC 700491 / DSM 11845 / VT8) TaxID=351348 RepID=A1U3V3_MARN8|nr:dTDP-4-dehydrorhamnose 3,5-epimerase family protein [Marinobacter nauticus]ABM19672.1 dTDP-4-dehydrorhamnose 3,5-epimerase related protein [Marinobacter nauticus VT8]